MRLMRVLCIVLTIGSTVCRAQAGLGAATVVGAVFKGLEDLAKQLEDSAHSLLQAGNAYAGQQQLTLAATIRATLEESRATFKDSLQDLDTTLAGQRRSSFDSLKALLQQADQLRGKISCDMTDSILLVSGQANVVLGRLPLTSHPPIFFGILPRDPACSRNEAADIVLTGFYLADAKLKAYPPVVVIDGVQIPAKNISTRFDRVAVVLPDELRARLDFRAGGCNRPKPYRIELKTYWTNWPSLVGINKLFVNESSFSDFAKSGRQQYDVLVRLDAANKTSTPAKGTFRVGSGSRNWGCEENVTALATFTARQPGAVIDAGVKGKWNMNGKWENNTPGDVLINGATVTSTGRVRGANRIDYLLKKDCPGGGNGEYFLSGSFTYPVASEEPIRPVDTQIYSNTLDEDLAVSLKLGATTLPKNLHIELRKHNCGELVDSLDLALNDDKNSRREGTSKNSKFKVIFDAGGQVKIQGTNSLEH